MRYLKILLLAVLTLSIVSCEQKDTSEWIVSVNNNKITKQDVETGLQNLSPELAGRIPQNQQAQIALQQLIQNEIFYLEAVKNKLEGSEDYVQFVSRLERQFEFQKKQALVDLFLKQNVDDKIQLSDQEISAAFDSNKDFFGPHQLRSVSHIVVKTKQEADKLFKRIKKGSSFAKLAKSNSIDTSTAQSGGKIQGAFRKNSLNKEFSDAIFSLKSIGSISSPVNSPAGFHIFKLDAIENVKGKSLEEVKPLLENQLYSNKRTQEINTLLTTLKETYTINENESLLEENKNEEPHQHADGEDHDHSEEAK